MYVRGKCCSHLSRVFCKTKLYECIWGPAAAGKRRHDVLHIIFLQRFTADVWICTGTGRAVIKYLRRVDIDNCSTSIEEFVQRDSEASANCFLKVWNLVFFYHMFPIHYHVVMVVAVRKNNVFKSNRRNVFAEQKEICTPPPYNVGTVISQSAHCCIGRTDDATNVFQTLNISWPTELEWK